MQRGSHKASTCKGPMIGGPPFQPLCSSLQKTIKKCKVIRINSRADVREKDHNSKENNNNRSIVF